MMTLDDLPDQPQMPKRFGISLDILWLLIILSAFLFFVSLVPLPPNDFWWHLKIGEFIYTNHTIPSTNMYAWTIPTDQPFIYGAWLGELLLYLLYHIGQLPLIIAMRTLLIGLAVWLMAVEARRRSGSWRITALVIALFSFMVVDNLIVRTQMWAWLPFMVTYIVLQRYSEGLLSWHWLLLCPVCMIFWVNVHGSFILGLLLPVAYFVGEAVRKLIKQPEALTWQSIGLIGGTGIASGLATLVNPRFIGIISYTTNLLTNPPSQQLIEEWQSPTPQGIANITFYLSILFLIIVLATSKYRLTLTEIILVAGFLWLAWSGQRYVIWYGMVTVPILARLIKDLPLKLPAFTPQKNWINLALAVFIFVPTLLVQPWFVERVPLPANYWKQVQRNSSAGPLLNVNTPVKAAEYLKAHPGGRLFNEMGYGSYLIWAISQVGVFIDPRVELYPYSQWMDYIQINQGKNYNELLRKYGADRILLNKELQESLANSLAHDLAWKLEYEDEYAQIWSENASTLSR